jgi:hypothetical protein
MKQNIMPSTSSPHISGCFLQLKSARNGYNMLGASSKKKTSCFSKVSFEDEIVVNGILLLIKYEWQLFRLCSQNQWLLEGRLIFIGLLVVHRS